MYIKDIAIIIIIKNLCCSDEFQSIACVDESLSNGMLLWRNNWVTFIDSMLQLNILRQTHHSVSQPTAIQSIVIDVDVHNKSILKSQISEDNNVLMWAQVSKECDNTR